MIRYDSRGEHERLHVVVNNLNGSPAVNACFGAEDLGMIDLMENHSGELELNTYTAPDEIPNFVAGDVIDIRDGGCAGEILISAEFGTGPPFGAPIGPADSLRLFAKAGKRIGDFMARLNGRFDQTARRTRLRIAVENVNVAGPLAVCLDSVLIGMIDLDEGKSGVLELSTQNGDAVPEPVEGSTVDITAGTCADEALISAVFELHGKAGQSGGPSAASSRSRVRRGRP